MPFKIFVTVIPKELVGWAPAILDNQIYSQCHSKRRIIDMTMTKISKDTFFHTCLIFQRYDIPPKGLPMTKLIPVTKYEIPIVRLNHSTGNNVHKV